jgi:ArsR family transcriptional regulator
MNTKDYENRAKVFKAMAHPSRLLIIDKLSHGECCVCEFVKEIKADFSTISRHLSVLKNAGIIACEKRGQQVFYNLQMKCVTGFNQCVDQFIENGTNIRIYCQNNSQEAKQ